MADDVEHLETCGECGATIYPEHVKRGMAERIDGKLLCVHCLKDRRSAGEADEVADEAGNPLSQELTVAYDRKPTAIRSFGNQMREPLVPGDDSFRRALLRDPALATRCKIFHCKLADAVMNHMCAQINEWADAHDDVVIKFATSCIGVVEGKHADPHLIVTVFY